MDSLLESLENVRRAGVQFVQAPTARVLAVTADGGIRDAAIETLAQIEWHPANRYQVSILAGDASTSGEWWQSAANQLRETQSTLSRAYVTSTATMLRPWPDDSSLDRVEPITTFVRAVASTLTWLRSVENGPESLLLIVAPNPIGDLESLANGAAMLIGTPALEAVRWVYLGERPFISALRARVESCQIASCDARVDQARQNAEIEAILASIARGGRSGCASPAAVPPPHPSEPAISPVSKPAPGLSPKARESLVEGVRAIRRGDVLAAIRHQRTTCDVCLTEGQIALAIEMELLLATYAIQACFTTGAPVEPAVHLLQRVATRASSAQLHLAVAKANYVLGTLASATNDHYLAGQSFRRSATAADAAGSPVLKIEALRAAGERLLVLGSKKRAAAVFGEAAATAMAGLPVQYAGLELVLRRLDELGLRGTTPLGKDNLTDDSHALNRERADLERR